MFAVRTVGSNALEVLGYRATSAFGNIRTSIGARATEVGRRRTKLVLLVRHELKMSAPLFEIHTDRDSTSDSPKVPFLCANVSTEDEQFRERPKMNSDQTFSATEFGYTIDLNNPPISHVGPIVEAVRTLLRRSGAKASASGPKGPARGRVTLNLSDRDSPSDDEARIEFLVEEGLRLYRLGSKASGWGSVEGGGRRARVMVVRLRGNSREGEVLAEAEIRTSVSRPWRNAEQIANAAAGLVRQGCLSRTAGRPIHLPQLNAPKLSLKDRLRWTWHHYLPSLWDSVAWRLGFARSLQWSIGLLPRTAIGNASEFPWDLVTWLKPPENGIIADPFLIEADGQHWLFYERMLFNETKGTIWVGQVDRETGELSGQKEVLSSVHHLSFPNLLKVDKQWYLLSEQGQCGATKLYRAICFPYLWEEHRDLLPNFPGIDPVIHQHGGKWWLFVTHDAAPSIDNNLHLFSSDNLDGEFVPHPLNPIKSGLFGSRMAGPLFKSGDCLMRPGQDGRKGYGHGVVLFKITTLNATDFAEEVTTAWQPESSGQFGYGFHTFQVSGEYIAIDGQQLVQRSSKWYKHPAWLYTGAGICDLPPALNALPMVAGI